LRGFAFYDGVRSDDRTYGVATIDVQVSQARVESRAQPSAVKANRVFEVNDEIWVNSWHIIGANLILNDLLKYLSSRPSSA
jgi:ABC-type Fe3+-hydroxamate transport system substrate-binding protein